MIPELYKATQADQSVQKVFQYLHQKSVPVNYVSTPPTMDQVPTGALVIHDNASSGTANVMRVYLRTGSDNVGYFSMTQVTA